jgi:hypothetical protein
MAQMDSVSFVRSIAKVLSDADGCSVHEKTRIMNVSEAILGSRHKLTTADGKSIHAEHVGAYNSVLVPMMTCLNVIWVL